MYERKQHLKALGLSKDSQPDSNPAPDYIPVIHARKHILIVGHGAMNLSIIGRIRKLPIEDFWTPGIESCRMIRLI